MYDVIIVGAGPAGMNASLYAKRSGLNVLLIDKNETGGVLNWTNKINNVLGFGEISGIDISNKMREHLDFFDIEFKKEEVIHVSVEDKLIVKTKDNSYTGKSLIIAVGRIPKSKFEIKLDKYHGKGVSYCAICDSIFYKNKDVILIGDDEELNYDALDLIEKVNKLYIIINDDMQLDDKIINSSKVEIMRNNKIKDIYDDNGYVNGVELDDRKIDVTGIFVCGGYEVEGNFISDLNINIDKSFIKVNDKLMTEIAGVFAAGDVVKKDYYQVVTALNDGLNAGLNAKKYLDNCDNLKKLHKEY